VASPGCDGAVVPVNRSAEIFCTGDTRASHCAPPPVISSLSLPAITGQNLKSEYIYRITLVGSNGNTMDLKGLTLERKVIIVMAIIIVILLVIIAYPAFTKVFSKGAAGTSTVPTIKPTKPPAVPPTKPIMKPVTVPTTKPTTKPTT
jgi:hypothetical protein